MNHDLLVDGPLRSWHPALIGSATLVGGFAAYMIVGSLVAFVMLVATGASLTDVFGGGGPEVLAEHFTLMLTGNAVGLALGLGASAILVARLQSSRPWTFLRATKLNVRGAVFATIGLVAMLPSLLWLGELNERLPLPEAFRLMEEEQQVLLELALSDHGSLFIKLLLMAVAPALFEEVFFRGVIQRNFERAGGAIVGVLLTGVLFGLFHLRFSQALPLIVIGIYLGYLAWCTGSLWVPILVHFANNALATVFASVAEEQLGMDPTTMEASVLPWYVVAFGAVVLAWVVIELQRLRKSSSP